MTALYFIYRYRWAIVAVNTAVVWWLAGVVP